MENTEKKERLINVAVTVSAVLAIACVAYFMLPVAMQLGHY